MRFLFFSKTPWAEAPRLRHQLARLLAGEGHEVIFFQKPSFLWEARMPAFRAEPRITVMQHRELVHHKLRLWPAIRRLNAAWVSRDLRKVSQAHGFAVSDIVVNFNYDYGFLRALFPRNRFITIINDDFTATAMFGRVKVLADALEEACAASDRVLTVSEPLRDQLRSYCEPHLFQPWADRDYAPSATAGARDILLYWGFISDRLDVGIIDALLREIERGQLGLTVLFVGPVQGRGLPKRIRESSNVRVLEGTSLDNLPLDRVLAGLIPYRSGVRDFDAITLPNKALQFLARGIPLLVSGMPHLTPRPFVIRLDDGSIGSSLQRLQDTYDEMQPEIRRFVQQNGARARLAQFLDLIPECPPAEDSR